MIRKEQEYGSGYFTGTPLGKGIPKDALISPSFNIVYDEDDHPTSYNGFAWGDAGEGGSSTFALDDGWASLGNDEDTDVGSGNVIEYYNKSLYFVGTGALRASFPSVNALVQAVGTASSIPQIAVLNGTLDGWETPVQLGLAIQGTPPVISFPTSIGVGFGGLLNGSRSFKVSAYRETTGAYSIASPSSNVLAFVGQTAIIDMPPTRVDGTTDWFLYATPRGFGTVGFYLQVDATINETELDAGTVDITNGNTKIKSTGVSRQLEVEFLDEELLLLKAPKEQFPAESCSFISAIGNVSVLIGTFGGVGISPSIPNEPESFPPLNATFVAEPITGVSRPQSGFLYVMTANSIWIVMLGGNALGNTPAMARSFVDGIGIRNIKSAITIGDDLYIFSSGGKPIRISSGGQIDLHFGDKVIDFFDTWEAQDVKVGYNERNNTVIYAYNNEMISYDIDKDRWNSPIYLATLGGHNDGIFTSIFTRDGIAKVVIWDVSEDEYYIGEYNKGTTGSEFELRTAWDDGGDYSITKDAVWSSGVIYSEDVNESLTGRFYKDNEGSANYTFPIPDLVAGNNFIGTLGTPSYFMRSFCFSITGEGYNVKFIKWMTDYNFHKIRS